GLKSTPQIIIDNDRHCILVTNELNCEQFYLMPQSASNKPFECTICKKKRYKSSAGLSRHENSKHNDYNTPPIQHYVLPENAINEWKKMLV
ncbi:9500_t:CDS:2, partial [Racocetra persica]